MTIIPKKTSAINENSSSSVVVFLHAVDESGFVGAGKNIAIDRGGEIPEGYVRLSKEQRKARKKWRVVGSELVEQAESEELRLAKVRAKVAMQLDKGREIVAEIKAAMLISGIEASDSLRNSVNEATTLLVNGSLFEARLKIEEIQRAGSLSAEELALIQKSLDLTNAAISEAY